ncbi:MAG: hydrogenase expression/formation protein HypE [Deltaproteobacteria bacterium]|nr:hydrogenase expression/formation protein HypE [Deltaproteobacteria bacterium]
MSDSKILLEHGDGGLLTSNLITEKFLPKFTNPLLEKLADGAVFDIGSTKLCFSTDSYVINPIFFPGGNIGSLAVHGTVNDVAMCGGKPLYLSAGFIIEEGLPLKDLEIIIASMADAANAAGVQIVTGDTKVVQKGSADGIFINTAGIGQITYPSLLGVASIRPGDAVIVSGSIGDHGAAVLSTREGINLSTPLVSDSAPLNGMVAAILDCSTQVHCLRDATRSGLGGILVEIAHQAGLRIDIDEGSIPVKNAVRGVCEILGFDPLFLANEGKMITVCGQDDADAILESMRSRPCGADAAVIGKVSACDRGRCIINTAIGSSRELDLPTGELVPRIC